MEGCVLYVLSGSPFRYADTPLTRTGYSEASEEFWNIAMQTTYRVQRPQQAQPAAHSAQAPAASDGRGAGKCVGDSGFWNSLSGRRACRERPTKLPRILEVHHNLTRKGCTFSRSLWPVRREDDVASTTGLRTRARDTSESSVWGSPMSPNSLGQCFL